MGALAFGDDWVGVDTAATAVDFTTAGFGCGVGAGTTAGFDLTIATGLATEAITTGCLVTCRTVAAGGLSVLEMGGLARGAICAKVCCKNPL